MSLLKPDNESGVRSHSIAAQSVASLPNPATGSTINDEAVE